VTSPAMRCASGVQVLLAQQMLEDRTIDDGRHWRLLLPLLRRPVQRALTMLAGLGLDSEPLTALQERQVRIETRQQVSPLAAAAPTAELSASIFVQLTSMAGADPELARDHQRSALRQLGYSLGELIYLIDALRDSQRDLARGSFNPCIESSHGTRVLSPERTIICRNRVAQAVAEVRTTVQEIEWRRHHHLIHHILCQQLPRIAGSHAERAVRLAEAGPETACAPAGVMPWFTAARCGKDQHADLTSQESDEVKRARQRNACDCCCCDCDCGSGGDGCSCCDGCDGCDCDCCSCDC
jgi:hypothetical protein